MKTKEFIKRVEELGYEVISYEHKYKITNNGVQIASVDEFIPMQISNYYWAYDKLCNVDKQKFFNLLVEYAKTPVEEREEEKEFYLKHRWIKGCVIMYLYRNTLNGYCYLGDKKCRPHRQKRFTLKEIEEIKEKYDTKLEDFEIVEVEE
ncbi:hypothetical protein [Anaerococcus nagyae]|uniref:hypothetical protein n=1 Tax=Anaerococcus nagyae TaxID=1755241 RepID=UPI00373709C6